MYGKRRLRKFKDLIRQTKIENDSYIKKYNLQIALRIIKLLDGNHQDDCFAFFISFFNKRELNQLHEYLMQELKKMPDVLENMTDRFNIDQKEFYKNTCEVILESQEISVKFYKYLKRQLRNMYNNLTEVNESLYAKRITNLGQMLGLDAAEQNIILFYFLVGASKPNESLFEVEWEIDASVKNISVLSEIINVPVDKISKVIGKNGILFTIGLIKKRYRTYELTDTINEFLLAGDPDKLFDSFFKEIETSDAFKHDDSLIPESEHKIIKSLCKSNTTSNILFLGPPGAGKTAYTSTLAMETGKRLYSINVDSNGEDSLDARKMALFAAERIFSPKKHIILVDEADKLLNVGEDDGFFSALSVGKNSNEKAFINTFLESTKNTFVYISNKENKISESTKRRFNYTLKFKDFNDTQRQSAWDTMLDTYNINWLRSQDILDYSKRYELNPGSISIALKSVLQMGRLNNSEKRVRLEKILENQLDFVKGKSPETISSSEYSLGCVNTDVDLNKIIQNIKKYYKYIEETPKENQVVKNYNMILSGPPGVGKTAFANHLAKELGKKIIVKKASDLKSKWVGESEKNIAEAFREAEQANAILFFDEGDSLFTSRDTAEKSWEVSQVNQLLSEVESFQGVFLTATNFLDNFDQASLRRFNEKIQFDYLETDSILNFYELFFKSMKLGPLNKIEKDRLKNISNLSIGDFKVVRDKNFFAYETTNEYLINQLTDEVKYKKENKPRIRL